MGQTTLRKNINLFVTLLCLSATAFAFQNCSAGFQLQEGPGTGSFVGASEALLLDGSKLYDNNCASCHNSLPLTTKANRSPAAINAAIATVAPMSGIKLTQEQINNISQALVSVNAMADGKVTCTAPAARGLSENKTRRLVKNEIIQILRDLFTAPLVADPQVEAQLGLIQNEAVSGNQVTAPPDSFASTHASAMLKISGRLADLAFTNTAVRDSIFGACSAVTPLTDACVQSFIQNFGLKIFRKPVSQTEITSYLATYRLASGQEGMKQVLMRFLLSPKMSYHLETDGVVQGNRVRLTDYEIASRIAFRVTGSLPDAQLLDAAARGQLQNIDNVRAHVQRLMTSDARGRAKIQEFFNFYLQSDLTAAPNAFAGRLNQIDVTNLRAEMITELREFVDNVVFTRNGNFDSLLTSREVFPRSARMSTILQAPVAVGNTPSITTAEHQGIILRPAMLSAAGPLTKPMTRGAVIRKHLLCDRFGTPNAAEIASRSNELGDLSALSNRDRHTTLTNSAACLGCHNRINPVGFVLEKYDQLGAVRSVESVFDQAGNVSRTFPINTLVSSPTFITNGSQTVSSLQDAVDLVNALAAGTVAETCFAMTVFEFQRFRPSSPDDFCAIADVQTKAGTQGTVLDAFITGVANEDIFWRAGG